MTARPHVTITPAEAVTAIEATAWTEEPRDEAYRNAVEALNRLTEEGPGPFTADRVRAVIAGHVPEPRKVIGAGDSNWDLADAVAFARSPGAVCRWDRDLLGDDLTVTAGGRTVRFGVMAPGPVRRRLKAARLLAQLDG